ncbi:Lrp/AsnC family transcriptional regulator [Candidatus Woesearchaeota archaeon]|jgi:Lrp/AsnC family transcriptional regulator, leucine-responsive regulatory protein|nr:Lrp/AsnC family transcriptional regulator [Candidatus Woesearchaeota archaeon]
MLLNPPISKLDKIDKLDNKDKLILFELDRAGRQPINELARKTRLSRDVVRYRIKQLEEKKVITNYITLIDFTKLGYRIVRLYLKLQSTTKTTETEMINFFSKMDEVIVSYRTDGHYDIALGFLVNDLRDYQKAYEQILIKYRKFIVEKNFCVFTNFIHYFRNYLLLDSPKSKKDFTELTTGSWEKFDYDLMDLKILKEISENARMSLRNLSTTLNTPLTTIKYRLKRLEKEKVIVAYRALIDFNKLGYKYYKVDLILEDLKIIPGLQEYVRNNPNIIYRDVAVGGSDFEFDCELASQDNFYEMIEEIKQLFPGKIRSYFYYKSIKIHKYLFFPKLIMKQNKI